MKRNYLHTALRTIFALLVVGSALAVILGIQWYFGGNTLYHTEPIDGEDATPLVGIILSMAGQLLILFGGLFTILFILLFKSVGKKKVPKTVKPTVIKPKA